MREEVKHLVESEGGTFSIDKTDRAINRAAKHIHNVLSRAASIHYARGSVQFSLTPGSTTVALPTLNDMHRPRYVRAVVSSYTPGFRLTEECSDRRYDCCLIPERMRDSDQYRSGVDPRGRPVAFLSHSASRRNAVQTVTFTGTPTSGNWTIGIGADLATVAYNVTASALKTALEGLESIGIGQVSSVTGSVAAGFVITFAGTLGFTEVDDLDVAAGTLDGGTTVACATTTEGVAAWSITFIAAPISGSTTYELVYDKFCRTIRPNTGEAYPELDLLTYETIPDEWHELICLRAAISILGIHNESQSALVEEHNVAYDELKSVVKAGQSAGMVQKTGW